MEKLFVPLQSRIPELLFDFSPAILHSDFETLPIHCAQGQGDNQALLFLGLGIIREVSTPLPHYAS